MFRKFDLHLIYFRVWCEHNLFFFNFYNTLVIFFCNFCWLGNNFIPDPVTRTLNNKRWKLLFKEKLSLLLMGHHATPLVTRFCFLLTCVTYRKPCHVIGHQVIYCLCYRFEKVFFIVRHFLSYIPFCFILLWLLRCWQVKTKVSRASC